MCNTYIMLYLWHRTSQKGNISCVIRTLIFLHCKVSVAISTSDVSRLCVIAVTACLVLSTPLFIEGNTLVLS
jgi:hypothetical protein